MKIEIINKEEIKNLFKNHGDFACVCYNTPNKFSKKVGKMGKKGLQSGQISCNISIVARTRGRFRAQRAEGERPREVAGDCHPGNFRGRAHKTAQRA